MKTSGSLVLTQRRRKESKGLHRTQVCSLSPSSLPSPSPFPTTPSFPSLPLPYFSLSFSRHFTYCFFESCLLQLVPCFLGYDDENGSYIKILHDHIAYRYEIKEVIGKGSFGQVVKVLSL